MYSSLNVENSKYSIWSLTKIGKSRSAKKAERLLVHFLSALSLRRLEVTLHKPLPKAPYVNAYRHAGTHPRFNRHTCCLLLILLYSKP